MKKDKHSHISADAEQAEHLSLEYALAEKNKGVNIALIAAFFAFIFVFAVLFWVLPDKVLSETENRSLQSFPTFTLKTLSDGTFTEEFATYMADQFPARDFFVGVKAATESALLKGQNNGVINAKDGYLITRYDSVDETILENNIDCISKFVNAAEAQGISVTCAFAGRTMDVASSLLPKSYGDDSSVAAWAALDKFCEEKGLSYVDLLTPLKARFEAGEYVYYRTDHHWTTLGAMYAYNEIALAADLPVASAGGFDIETASDAFYGTTWSTAGIKWAKPDTMEFYRFAGDDLLTTEVKGVESFQGLYKREALETKDKYTSFIGGNAAEVHVTACDGQREKILLVKDSFAHSVVPFLADEYDLVIVDLRYYSKPLTELCRDEGIEKVIILYNMDTLSSEAGFRIFRMGINK